MKYTPKTHAVRMMKRLLGCEDWVPPDEVISQLRNELEDYNDIYSITHKLRDLNAKNCYGHEHLLSCLLMDKIPDKLSPESQKNLENDFSKWWGSNSPKRENRMIQRFVEDWLKRNKV